jgi:flavin reductase (DIM6/NTAB) family NADH-FMN oxidoreductase RutF
MSRISISPDKLQLPAIKTWSHSWPLLTSGDFDSGEFNTMTVGWGSLGVMWKKPMAMVVVRPSRYTYELMEKYDTFTLSVLPKEYRAALQLCGTKSGRDLDKIKAAGLTAIPSSAIAAPGFDEAGLIIECRAMYKTPFTPDQFLDPQIMASYPEKNFHLMTFGEIVAIHGTASYAGTEAEPGDA